MQPVWDRPVDDDARSALEELGRQVLGARRHSGSSQRGLERATGIDQSTISRIEHGRATGLPLWRFALLVRALDAGVATRRPAPAHGLEAPGSAEWINGGPAWDHAVEPDSEPWWEGDGGRDDGGNDLPIDA
jgi:transcriptional regulator with XRE-family HTH domain